MHHRLILAGLGASGGLLVTAFLQTAVAVASTDGAAVDTAPSVTGADAFTLGNYTFDPFTVGSSGAETEGFATVGQLTSSPPLLQLGGGTPLGLALAPQSFEVFSPSDGTDLGNISTGETVTNLLGLTNTEFTVESATAASGESASDLPAAGSVYDVFNLGNGYENVYTAIPGSGSSGDTVTDTLVTPFGNVDLGSLFGGIDAAAPLQPGDAFTGLEGATSAGGSDAFAIGGSTLDPFTTGSDGTETEGFAPVDSAASAPPLLNIGGVSLGDPSNSGNDLATQDFNVFSGTGSGATDVGTITTGEDVTNLLGMTNTQLVVTGATPASGETAADLPATGTVYDAVNLGNGYENLYTATPGSGGTVTDTLMTPFGNINLSSLFGDIDAAAPLQPGDAFTGLQDSSIGPDAFTIGDTTFDPFTTGSDGTETEGFTPVAQTIGAPPLLAIGGGTPSISGITLPLATQDFNVFDSTGTDLGSIDTDETVTNLLGMTNTEFTVESATPASGESTSDLPAAGSVYDVFNLGNGYENVYTAIPGSGSSGDTITDTLVTPFGNINLDSLFGGIDAAVPLNPGDAFTGLDAVSAAASDPLAFLGL